MNLSPTLGHSLDFLGRQPARPIASGDISVRPEAAYPIRHIGPLMPGNEVDGLKRCQYFQAVAKRVKGSAGAFETANIGVDIQGHNQQVAQSLGGLEMAHM